MTTVLALDTSQDWCSTAISKNGVVIAHTSTQMQAGHSQALVPSIIKTAADAQINLSDLDMIITITGPGSFTGLRISIATAQGLGLALNIPVMGINSFKAYANCVESNCNILIAIESQKQDIYCQLFNSRKEAIKPAVALNPTDIMEYTQNSDFVLAGSATDKITPHLIDKPSIFEISHEYLCKKLSLSTSDQNLKYSPDLSPLYIKEAIASKPKIN